MVACRGKYTSNINKHIQYNQIWFHIQNTTYVPLQNKTFMCSPFSLHLRCRSFSLPLLLLKMNVSVHCRLEPTAQSPPYMRPQTWQWFRVSLQIALNQCWRTGSHECMSTFREILTPGDQILLPLWVQHGSPNIGRTFTLEIDDLSPSSGSYCNLWNVATIYYIFDTWNKRLVTHWVEVV